MAVGGPARGGTDTSRPRATIRAAAVVVAVGVLLLVSAACEPLDDDARSWADVARWDHAWDASEAIGYVDDGRAYGQRSTVRVQSVPDSAGDTPLVRDGGPYQHLFGGLPAAPGPIFVPGSPAFAGRPAWQSDVILESSGFFDNYHSMLSPQTDKDDRSQWYGWLSLIHI